jgi:drug/metabolite transporter (DMT)-like permease
MKQFIMPQILKHKLVIRDYKAIGAYIAICIIWGSGYLVNRIGIQSFPPVLFMALRLSIAGGIILAYAGWKKLSFPRNVGQCYKIIVAGLLLFFGGNGLGIIGLKSVTAGTASLLVTTVPIFTALIERLSPNSKRIGIGGWIGLLLGFGGVVLLIVTGQQIGAFTIQGCFLVTAGALCWAAGSVFNSRAMNDLPLMVQGGAQMLIGGLALMVLGVVRGDFAHFQLSLEGVMAFLYMLFLDAMIANSLYLYLLRIWTPTKVGTYAYLTPVIAGFLGVIWLNEPFSAQLVFSGVLILGGVLLVQKYRTIC